MSSGDSQDAPTTISADGPTATAGASHRTLDGLRAEGRIAQFASTRRYALVRRIGAGGMGVVYEALDQDRGEHVALKTILGVDAQSIYRFKREFRALADVSHPNLVSLYELVAEGDLIFFTMEYVAGETFLEWVWNESASGERRRVDLGRLRACLRQLAIGLHHLHGAGKLHRDLKPSNVLVDGTGCVKILDFGLVGELSAEGDVSGASHVVGTPAYMSPEQAAGEHLGPATDWYALGVMLYQALTGRMPFPGRGVAMLLARQDADGPRPSQVQAGLPADLDTLCEHLMRRDPSRRAGAPEVLAAVGSSAGTPSADPTVPLGANAFVGRERELRELRAAFEATYLDGPREPVVVSLRGPSGMGKSTLVRRFLEQPREDGSTVVLQGRCFERESVPYKGVDHLFDALSRYLVHLPGREAAALTPRDAGALARIFPVLARVPSISRGPERGGDDPRELRRRAFRAAREILGRIADRDRLVLWLDDMQWSDSDSTELLLELLRPPDPPSLLLVLSSRDDRGDPELVAALRRGLRARELSVRLVELELAPLVPEEARRLAENLVGRDVDAAVRARNVAVLAEESGGSPLFLGELARWAQHADRTTPRVARLDELLRERVQELEPAARRVLEAVALAGGPVGEAVALTAAHVGSGGHTALLRLRSERLLRTSGAAAERSVEPYHDRIREAVVATIDEAARITIHGALAEALEAHDCRDAELMAAHLRAAGRGPEAAGWAVRAADDAREALAFDRAARLCDEAIALLPAGDPRILALRIAGAEALSLAGWPIRGAHACLAAADDADPDTALQLRLRAADQLLRCGQEEGLALTREVLAAIGMRLPSTRVGTLTSLAAGGLRLRLSDLEFRPRRNEEISPALLRRVDMCAALANGLAGVDVLMAWDFQTRQTLLALSAGEPSRVSRALAMQSIFATFLGAGNRPHIARMLEVATRLAREQGDEHATGLVLFAEGMNRLWVGNFAAAVAPLDQAAERFRAHGHGIPWHLGLAELFAVIALTYVGRFEELQERHARALRELRARDERYAWVGLMLGRSNLVWLRADDPGGARAACEEGLANWSHRGYDGHRYWGLLARVQTDLYEGRGQAAADRIAADLPLLRRAGLLRVHLLRLEVLHLHCQARLLAAEERGKLEPVVGAEVERTLAEIQESGVGAMVAQAELTAAGLARLRGEPSAALARLEAAERSLEAASLHLHAAAARHHRGLLLGGEAGRRLVSEALAICRTEGIAAPLRWLRMIAPGFG